MLLNSASIQRRAAPMPRLFDCVSESVCRVPKLTSFLMSVSILVAEGALAISCSLSVDASIQVEITNGKKANKGLGSREYYDFVSFASDGITLPELSAAITGSPDVAVAA